MPDIGDEQEPDFPNPREEDIMAGDRRISRPDSSLPDWYISDASYRPIPIAWFAAAIILQSIAITVIAFVFLSGNAWITLIGCALASVATAVWTMQRGLAAANQAWTIALVIVMSVQFLFIAIGLGGRL
ncbi:MAG: hypothetical protein AAF127_01830 [Pseudomonadota bacterium]